MLCILARVYYPYIEVNALMWTVIILPVCRAERKGLGEGIAARLQPREARSRQGLCDQKGGVIPQARTKAQSGVK